MSRLTRVLAITLGAAFVAGFTTSANAYVTVFDDTFTLTGGITSTGSGPYATWGKQYAGEYTLQFDYVINVTNTTNGGGKLTKVTLDPTGSYIAITNLTQSTGPFDTIDIPITSASFKTSNDSLTSFKFAAEDWFASLPDPLTQDGIKGSISLKNSTAYITGSYQHPPITDGGKSTTLTYVFNTKKSLDAPTGGRFSPYPDIPAVPEPATWAMMLVGLGLTGAVLRRGRRKALLAGA